MNAHTPLPLDQPPDHGEDLGEAFQTRPSEIVCLEGRTISSVRSQGVPVRRMKVECVLDGLLNAGQITDAEWRAGWIFRRDWMCVVRMPRVTASYTELLVVVNNPGEKVGDALAMREAANARLQDAYKALGLMRSPVVNEVCGMDGAARGRVKELRVALGVLVALYRVPEDYSRTATRGR